MTTRLENAIRNYAGQWSQHSGIETDIHIPKLSVARFAPNIETNLYRIVQEALNNIHKHAKAARVEILLEERDGDIVLVIVDDGRGFSLKSKRNRLKGLGLTGMSERASLIGGTLEFETAPGKGTTIHVRLPVKRKNKRKAIKAVCTTDWSS